MNVDLNEVKTLRLEAPVVVRKVPMTAQGSDMLRAVRAYQVAQYAAKGIKVDIPFPVSIHLALKEFCSIKGLKVESNDS